MWIAIKPRKSMTKPRHSKQKKLGFITRAQTELRPSANEDSLICAVQQLVSTPTTRSCASRTYSRKLVWTCKTLSVLIPRFPPWTNGYVFVLCDYLYVYICHDMCIMITYSSVVNIQYINICTEGSNSRVWDPVYIRTVPVLPQIKLWTLLHWHRCETGVIKYTHNLPVTK